MRVSLLILCCIISVIAASAQNVFSQVTDSNTGLPIPFVNIGIVGKNIGTVSDQEGNFQLSLTSALDTDTLRFSMVSYISKEFNLSELRKSEFPKSIQLIEKVIQLREVIITAHGAPPIQLGIKKKYCYPIPLYKGASSKISFPQKGYRHEIGTRFSNSKTIYLDSIQLNLAECTLERLEFRLNVYSIENETFKNILGKPIYISLTKEEALNSPIINLMKHLIEIESDFLITIENYKKIRDNVITIFANFKSKGKMYPTYYRHSSQSDWVNFKAKKFKEIGLSFLAFAH